MAGFVDPSVISGSPIFPPQDDQQFNQYSYNNSKNNSQPRDWPRFDPNAPSYFSSDSNTFENASQANYGAQQTFQQNNFNSLAQRQPQQQQQQPFMDTSQMDYGMSEIPDFDKFLGEGFMAESMGDNATAPPSIFSNSNTSEKSSANTSHHNFLPSQPSSNSPPITASPVSQDDSLVERLPMKRGRKKKAPKSTEEQEVNRQRFLERNRVAASKCREKKKAWVDDLEDRRLVMQRKNDHLTFEISKLTEEVNFLKGLVHKHQGCPGMDGVQALEDVGGAANPEAPVWMQRKMSNASGQMSTPMSRQSSSGMQRQMSDEQVSADMQMQMAAGTGRFRHNSMPVSQQNSGHQISTEMQRQMAAGMERYRQDSMSMSRPGSSGMPMPMSRHNSTSGLQVSHHPSLQNQSPIQAKLENGSPEDEWFHVTNDLEEFLDNPSEEGRRLSAVTAEFSRNSPFDMTRSLSSESGSGVGIDMAGDASSYLDLGNPPREYLFSPGL